MKPIAPSSPFLSSIRRYLVQQPRWAHTEATQEAIEEQTLPSYYRKTYYPVRIGQIFNDRYRIIAKLGYGAYSTVWLANDERAKEYKTLKVTVQVDDSTASTSPVLNEIKMLRHMKTFVDKEHPGLFFTRLADDILEIDGPAGGRHYCVVSKPQGNSVHISPQNVLMYLFDDTSSLEQVEEMESQEPSVPIIANDYGSASHITYKSRSTMLEISGHPILTDFGQMRHVEGCINQDWWMPDIYRAPEVLLQLPWSYAVDIWSIGVMTLELLEGKNLFDPVDRVHRQYVLPLAIAQYIGYLGFPPLNIIEKSPLFSTYFDAKGEAPIPKTSLEDFVTTIPPGKEKDMFLRFIRKILTWDQEARETANEIILDEWLMMPNESL
ncbi:protein kinase domain-containing protein [Microsporum canis CBS 113480]|uniref:non-specific serine/threonine protein kinase n=1 Tax=Arthroderma otae (strain ATCC MYA-4605 / CBS 113480) TaxID=554155 RepID=C5FMS9_ARTOC|nr:protein kinase domain-containing protein [Microsporum canis CBS 113480]EEQ31900.1 protein kinase domain-containing protein [Microsporum canis CBS 113480]